MTVKSMRKKIILSVFIILFSFPINSHAFVPLGYYLAWSVLGHVYLAEGYLAYLVYNYVQGQKKVSESGDIATPAQVTWVDLNDPSTPAIKQKEVTHKITESSVIEKVNASPSSYPKLKAAIDSVGTGSTPINAGATNYETSATVFPVGTILVNPYDSSLFYQVTISTDSDITSVADAYACQFNPPRKWNIGSTADPNVKRIMIVYCDGTTQWFHSGEANVIPQPQGETLTNIISDSGNLKLEYDEEITRLIQNSTVQNGDIIDIKMDGGAFPTGSTFSQPSPPTPSQIEGAGGISPSGSGLVSDGSSPSGGTTGTATLTIPDFTYTDFGSSTAGSSPYGSINGHFPDNFDFSARFGSFMDTIKTSALFGLSDSFLTNVPEGGSSTFTFSAGRYGSNLTFDYSSLNPVFTILKAVLLVIFSWVSIRIVLFKGAN